MGARPSKDMAICLVVFNPAQTKRLLMNYLYARNKFELQGLPVFTIELVYEGREPEIPDAVHVRSNSVMFHKENLYRILVKRLPKQYTKLAFLDSDVFFKDPTWYEKTSELLETHDIVQPFEEAHWLDLTYRETQLSRKTVCLMPGEKWSFEYHPGFAWCMRRKWYKHNGFFDYAVSGSGDTLSTAVWLKKKFPDKFQSLPKAICGEYFKYQGISKPRITYLKGYHLYHLYHGSRVNRQYAERHKLLNVGVEIQKLVRHNADGVMEWREPQVWNPMFQAYFENRHDDDLSVDVPPPQPQAQTKKPAVIVCLSS
jgi:hypothetical protein